MPNPRAFDPERYRRERQNLRAAERLDVLEPPAPKRGCNVRARDGKLCGRRVVAKIAGTFSEARLCSDHLPAYLEQCAVIKRIRALTRNPELEALSSRSRMARASPRR